MALPGGGTIVGAGQGAAIGVGFGAGIGHAVEELFRNLDDILNPNNLPRRLGDRQEQKTLAPEKPIQAPSPASNPPTTTPNQPPSPSPQKPNKDEPIDIPYHPPPDELPELDFPKFDFPDDDHFFCQQEEPFGPDFNPEPKNPEPSLPEPPIPEDPEPPDPLEPRAEGDDPDPSGEPKQEPSPTDDRAEDDIPEELEVSKERAPGLKKEKERLDFRGEPNSIIRGSDVARQGGGKRAFITDENGRIIKEITPQRVKIRIENSLPDGTVRETFEKVGKPSPEDLRILERL